MSGSNSMSDCEKKQQIVINLLKLLLAYLGVPASEIAAAESV
jgi:hypothetical protein